MVAAIMGGAFAGLIGSRMALMFGGGLHAIGRKPAHDRAASSL